MELITCIVIMVVVFAAIGGTGLWVRKKLKKKSPDNFDGVGYGIEYIVPIIEGLGCRCECEGEEADGEGGKEYVYTFKYQGAYFYLLGNSESVFVKVLMPNIVRYPIEQIGDARVLCNEVNKGCSGIARVEYYISEDQKEVCVNVVIGMSLVSTMPTVSDFVERNLAQAFIVRSKYEEIEEQYQKEQKRFKMQDAEMEIVKMRKEKFLICEAELKHNHSQRMMLNEDTSLSTLMKVVRGGEDIIPLRLTITTNEGVTEIVDGKDAFGYDIAKVIVAVDTEDAKKSKFKCNWANVVFEYEKTSEAEAHKMILVHLIAEGDDDRTLFVRATYTQPGVIMGENNAYGHGSHRANAVSVLLAVDKVNNDAKKAELEYMWGDMMDKVAEGKIDEFTDEQKMIFGCEHPDIRRHLYFGKKYFMEGRLLDAIVLLENAHNVLMPNADTLNQRMHEIFFEVTYMLGFCYAELKRDDKALYYLEMVAFKKDVRYDMEYINCLVNSRDYRALEVVEQMTAKVEDAVRRIDEDEEQPDMLIAYRNFLVRRRSYLLVEKRRITEAKELLTKMLDDPDNRDFAIGELKFVEQLISASDDDKREDSETTE